MIAIYDWFITFSNSSLKGAAGGCDMKLLYGYVAGMAVLIVAFMAWPGVDGAAVCLLGLSRSMPPVLDPRCSAKQKTMSIADSVGQFIVLLALARLLAPGVVRDWPVRLLACGTACGLVGAVVFGLLRTHPVPWRLAFL